MKLTRLIPATTAICATLALAACQQAQQANPDAKPGVSVSDGELVLPAVSGNPGAAYFTVTNGNGKAVSLAAVFIDGAGKSEMHETMGTSMEPLASLEVKPGENVKFERSGRHVMVFDLTPKVAAGSAVEMTLTFADGDKVSAPLKVVAAGGGMEHGYMP